MLHLRKERVGIIQIAKANLVDDPNKIKYNMHKNSEYIYFSYKKYFFIG